MAQVQLKRLLRKKYSQVSLLNNIASVAPGLCIQDAQGTALQGTPDHSERFPIVVDDEILGWVSGSDQAAVTASLLSHLACQESENGKLSDEVLELYREINLFFNFAEKLTDVLEASTVAALTLEEIRRYIEATSGCAILVNEQTHALETVGAFGLIFETDEASHWAEGIIREVALSGKAEIVNDVWSDGRYHAENDSLIRSLIAAPLKFKQNVRGSLVLISEEPVNYTAGDLKLMSALASQAAAAIENARLHQQMLAEELIRSNLLRQFSPKVAENMVKSRGLLQLGGERVAPITLLISDVRGFTAHSAKLDPGTVVSKLNQMFSALIPIIFRHDGTVDKYVGDAILTVFGSPEPDDNQWIKAIKAALDMQEAMHSLDSTWRIGIGIHTGEAVHGFIGTSERMEYTIIGDTVNRASRLCDGAKGGEIVISREVYEKVVDSVQVELPPRLIKTKHPETESDLEAFVVVASELPTLET